MRNNRRTATDAEGLRRRIEETRAIAGHTLECSDCERLSSGRATGWGCGLGRIFVSAVGTSSASRATSSDEWNGFFT